MEMLFTYIKYMIMYSSALSFFVQKHAVFLQPYYYPNIYAASIKSIILDRKEKTERTR